MRPARLLASILALAALAGVLAGSAAPAPRASTTSPRAWVTQVCTSLKTWQHSVAKRSNAISHVKPKSLRALHDAFAAFLDAVVADTNTLVSSTKTAGTPSVPHGADVAGTLITGFSKLRGYFAADALRAKHLSKTNAKAFAAGARAIGTAIGQQSTEITKTFDQLDKRYRSAPLDKAMKSARACRGI